MPSGCCGANWNDGNFQTLLHCVVAGRLLLADCCGRVRNPGFQFNIGACCEMVGLHRGGFKTEQFVEHLVAEVRILWSITRCV